MALFNVDQPRQMDYEDDQRAQDKQAELLKAEIAQLRKELQQIAARQGTTATTTSTTP